MIKNIQKIALFASLASIATLPLSAMAAATVVVTPTNTQGWSTADTRPGGAVNFIIDPTSPAPNGALQLTTDATTTAKAQYLHAATTSLASVTNLSYYTKQVSAAFSGGDPSYQLITHLTGTSTGFSTLVFEPYQNPLQGAVVPTVWQKWDVSNGLFWSTRTVVCSGGTVVGTPGGPASYTLSQIKTMCPDATVAGFGVNVGSNNPLYNVETDLVNFNGTSYNFQAVNVPTDKNQCKNGGFANFTNANGKPFANQGACVSFVNNHGDNNDGQNDSNQQGDQSNS